MPIIIHIKSVHILKILFSHLWINRKLNILSYNKQIQNILKLNINNYKTISHREKIAEKNGSGKEYIINTDFEIFNGEYKNGKKDGKGKEYLIFAKLMIFEV